MSKEQVLDLRFRVADIRTAAFQFQEIDNSEFEQVWTSNEGLRLDLNISFDSDKDKQFLHFAVQSTYVLQEGNVDVVKHIGRTAFEVIGLESLYDKKQDVFNFPDEFFATLLSLSYTHSRALLASHLNGTMYGGKLILPVQAPQVLLGLFNNIQKEA